MEAIGRFKTGTLLLHSDANGQIAMEATILADNILLLKPTESRHLSINDRIVTANIITHHSFPFQIHLVGSKVLRNKQKLVIVFGPAKDAIYLQAMDEGDAVEWQRTLNEHTSLQRCLTLYHCVQNMLMLTLVSVVIIPIMWVIFLRQPQVQNPTGQSKSYILLIIANA